MSKRPNGATHETTHLSTGCTLLDLVVGGGKGMGFPAGRIVNVVGDKSSGKTFVCTEMIAANHHKFGKRLKFNYDDSETGFTFDTEGLYGVEILPEGTLLSQTVEEMDANVGTFLHKLRDSQLGIYVVDSLDGLSDSEKETMSEERRKLNEAGKEITDKGTYGMGTAKFLSQHFFKTKAGPLAEKNSLLVIISQVRENIGAGIYGKKHVRSGGKALDFYCHTVLWLANVCKIMKGDRQIGVVVEAKTEKSKTPRPFRKCRFSIYFDYGVDDIGSNLDYLFDLRGEDGKLKKVAEGICWSGEPITLESLKRVLEEQGLTNAAKLQKKEETGKSALSVDWVAEWLRANHSDIFTKNFGIPVTRAELISQMEESPKLREELQARVIAKWEKEESDVATNRKGKYE